jgi:hypothetical protein
LIVYSPEGSACANAGALPMRQANPANMQRIFIAAPCFMRGRKKIFFSEEKKQKTFNFFKGILTGMGGLENGKFVIRAILFGAIVTPGLARSVSA